MPDIRCTVEGALHPGHEGPSRIASRLRAGALLAGMREDVWMSDFASVFGVRNDAQAWPPFVGARIEEDRMSQRVRADSREAARASP